MNNRKQPRQARKAKTKRAEREQRREERDQEAQITAQNELEMALALLAQNGIGCVSTTPEPDLPLHLFEGRDFTTEFPDFSEPEDDDGEPQFAYSGRTRSTRNAWD